MYGYCKDEGIDYCHENFSQKAEVLAAIIWLSLGHYFAAPILNSPQLSHLLESEWDAVAPIALFNRNSDEVNPNDSEAARTIKDFYVKNAVEQEADKQDAIVKAFGDAFCVGGESGDTVHLQSGLHRRKCP